MDRKNKILLVVIYGHPEYYPPTLSALENLSLLYKDIYVLHRNVHGFNWKYPDNVHLVGTKKNYTPREVELSGFVKKLGWYISFTWKLFGLLKSARPDTVLIYDYQALLAYRLNYFFTKHPRILWYHNHDVGESQYIGKWSLSWWAWKSEKWIFPKLQMFSLPSVERKKCFPMQLLRGRFFYLPNFPSALIYRTELQNSKSEDSVYKILFQGSIGPMHGLEELISLLNEQIGGKHLELVLKGFVSPEYLDNLQTIASHHLVSDKLVYIGPTDYRQVIENGRNCHIGIGIHMKDDMMNQTLGTASNKIYEYAALGLPVILFDNIHFREILGKFRWAFFTDASKASLRSCLETIVSNYESLSRDAANDFNDELSFEYRFADARSFLLNKDNNPSNSH